MKLWLLEQFENDDYETYDSCVVAAETEDAARRIHPSAVIREGNWWEAEAEYKTYSWATTLENVNVTLLGEAVDTIGAGVICSSYNAG